MDELFRWITIRAPQSTDPNTAIALAASEGQSAFQEDLHDVLHPEEGPPLAEPWPQLLALAQAYQTSSLFVAEPALISFGAPLAAFTAWLGPVASDSPGPDWTELSDKILEIFGVSASDLMTDIGLLGDRQKIHDSIVALFIAAPSSPLLPKLAELARVLALIARVAAGDSALNEPNAAADTLSRTLLLPPTIFPIREGLVKPVGVADLLVVRQHLSHYELADLSHIENVMKGESKKSIRGRTLLTEQEETIENESTETFEEEQQTDERFDLKAEVSKVLSEDVSVKAGVDLTAKWDKTQSITLKNAVSYSEARKEAAKRATEFARGVVDRAASKVTNRVLVRQSRKVTELHEDHEEHGFTAKGAHRVGLYQWLTKVYTAQIFNLGKRLLFDLSVPEPAAFLLDALAAQRRNLTVEPPPAFTLRPDELVHDVEGDSNYYGTLLARYGVVGFTKPPPSKRVTAVRSITLQAAELNHLHSTLTWSGEVPIAEGYKAERVAVNGNAVAGAWHEDRKFRGMRINVGTTSFVFGSYQSEPESLGWLRWRDDFESLQDDETPDDAPKSYAPMRNAAGEVGHIPVTINANRVNELTVTVEVHCVLTDDGLRAWKLKVHQAILQAYNRQQSAYFDQLQAGSMRPQTRAALGGNPEENRRIERIELKKAAIQILAQNDLTTDPLSGIVDSPPFYVPVQPPDQPVELPPEAKRTYPRPDLATAQHLGRLVRFFEQAFEWECMTYLFYPYFWGRASTWYDLSLVEHGDPVFSEFLRAGSARVVIPVRPGFESVVQYFLLTGQIWGGGELPGITDTAYLPITEEIKAATATQTDGIPGPSWQVRVPTTLIRLRDDASLPEWLHLGDWQWSGT